MRDALFQEVVRQRSNAEVRRVFADWLADHEDPWGEFIHLQLEGHAKQRHGNREKGQVHSLEPEIRRRHAPVVSGKVTSFSFGGGCIEEIELTVPQLLHHGQQLTDTLPVRCIRISTDVEGWKHAMTQPAWRPIECLMIDSIWLGVDRIEQLANSSEMHSLSKLRLVGAGVCHHGVELLSASPHANQLSMLEFAGNRDIGDRGLQRLVTDDRFERLHRIGLRRCRITDRSLREIASHPSLTRIRHMDLRDNSVTVSAIEALQRSPFWHRDARLLVDSRKGRSSGSR